MNFGSAIFPELVTVTVMASDHPIFLHADPPDTTLMHALYVINILIGNKWRQEKSN